MSATFYRQLSTALLCACITLLSASAAFAGFDVSGHENFSGATLDTATWEQYPPGLDTQYGVFTQNNSLTINTTGPVTLADYTTRAVTVPIGGSVSAAITPGIFTPNGGGIWLYLTDNSGGEQIQANLDHKRIAMSMPFSDGTVYGGPGSDQNGVGNFVAQNLPTIPPSSGASNDLALPAAASASAPPAANSWAPSPTTTSPGPTSRSTSPSTSPFKPPAPAPPSPTSPSPSPNPPS